MAAKVRQTDNKKTKNKAKEDNAEDGEAEVPVEMLWQQHRTTSTEQIKMLNTG